jgi:putative FmdB family regulatory protein
MPIYEYSCRICGEEFEMFRAINSDDKQVQCPSCGGKDAKRKISAFIGKGSAERGNFRFPT